VKVPGLNTLKHSARWLRSRFVSGALILGYHRISDVPKDPFGMSVSAENFDQQLEIIRRHANPLSLDKLFEGLRDEHLPERAIALTFDDGYVDVLYHAEPLLRRYQIPATVFATTGHLGHPFWWDELAFLLFAPDLSPQRLSTILAGETFERIQAEIEEKKPSNDIETRQHLLMGIYKWFLHLPAEEREIGMSQLRTFAGSLLGNLPHFRTITPEELIELADGDLVDIGAHTVMHPVLTRLSLEEQQAEIQESKSYLENLLERPVTGFSYPNGSYTQETLAIVRECGFSYACASNGDIVRNQSQYLALPRFWIPNWDGPTFSRWLERWLCD
jgi:peptidoglycan/xylan/chitin deacetylase (PgdA/CDA1 family)